jgi:excisionase family DNA binding protein
MKAAEPLRLLTIQEVADLLQVSASFVEKKLHTGELGRVKMGRATRVTEGQLKAYVERNTY